MESDLKRLADLQRKLGDARTFDEALHAVLVAVTSAGFERCRVYSIRDNSETLELLGLVSTWDFVTERRFQGLRIDVDRNPLLAEALNEVRPTVIDPVTDNDQLFLMLGKAETAWMAVPLRRDNQLLGMMAVDNRSSGRQFTERDLDFMFIVGETLLHRWGNRPLTFADHLKMLKKSMVLILGKDTGEELDILRAMSDEVALLGYDPYLVKDVPEIPEMSNEEKVHSFAGASRFVLLENSFAAGQIAEMKILSTNRIVTAILRQQGKGSSWMVADYDLDYNFMKEFEYGPDGLEEAVRRACEWADWLVGERRMKLDARYPWRPASA